MELSKSNHLICLCFILVLLVGLSEAGITDEQQNGDEVFIPPNLKDDPDHAYEYLKKLMEDNGRDGSNVKVEGLGSLTLQQLVGACGSIEGQCDITDLGSLDEELFFSQADGQKASDWSKYLGYCRDHWVAFCDETDAVRERIRATFTKDEWQNTRELVDSVLRQPAGEKRAAVGIGSRYPEGLVQFMRTKDANLDQILSLKKGKRDQFGRQFAQTVMPVCQRAVSSLKYVVLGIKWNHQIDNKDDQIHFEQLNPTLETALKIFEVCLKISIKEEELVGLSYDIFSGKRKSLMSKIREKTLASLGANK